MNLCLSVLAAVLLSFSAQTTLAAVEKCAPSLAKLVPEALPPIPPDSSEAFFETRKTELGDYSDALLAWAKGKNVSQLNLYVFEKAKQEDGTEILIAMKAKGRDLKSSNAWSFRMRFGLVAWRFESKDLVLFSMNSEQGSEFSQADNGGNPSTRFLQLSNGGHLKIHTRSGRHDIVNNVDVEYFPEGAFEAPSTLMEATNNYKFKGLVVGGVGIATQIERHEIAFSATRERSNLVTLYGSLNLYDSHRVTIVFDDPRLADAAFLLLRELQKKKLKFEILFDENQTNRKYSSVYFLSEERWTNASEHTFLSVNGQSYRMSAVAETVRSQGIHAEALTNLFQ